MKKVIIEYTAQHSFRERMLLWLLGHVIPIHAQLYKRRQPWGLLREDLLHYAEGSLGHELGLFLQQERLQPIDRVERHDAFHILLGFSTSIPDEAAMQFFLTGNGKISPFTLATALFCCVVLPEQWSRFRSEFRRGRQARPLARWDFKELLDIDFKELQQFIFRMRPGTENLSLRISSFDRKKS